MLLCVGTALAFLLGTTATVKAQPEMVHDTNIVFEGTFDVAPSFPGGTEALWAFSQKNIKYKRNGVFGNIYVTFTIDTNGTVVAPKALNNPGRGCAKQAVQVVEKLPSWIPGSHKGQPVKVQCTLSVYFDYEKNRLQNTWWQDPVIIQDPLNPTNQVETESWKFHRN